jgi:predicted HD phosphohydrolase
MFTRLDQSTSEDWNHILAESEPYRNAMPERVLAMLRSLRELHHGFPVDQLEHALQTATLAERANASDEMIVASLCHDVGKTISIPNHPAIAAEILKPYVSRDVYQVILLHQDFQRFYYPADMPGDPNSRAKHVDAPWYSLAEKFCDEWDQAAFDRGFRTPPLEHFEPLVRAVFAAPKDLKVPKR